MPPKNNAAIVKTKSSFYGMAFCRLGNIPWIIEPGLCYLLCVEIRNSIFINHKKTDSQLGIRFCFPFYL